MLPQLLTHFVCFINFVHIAYIGSINHLPLLPMLSIIAQLAIKPMGLLLQNIHVVLPGGCIAVVKPN